MIPNWHGNLGACNEYLNACSELADGVCRICFGTPAPGLEVKWCQQLTEPRCSSNFGWLPLSPCTVHLVLEGFGVRRRDCRRYMDTVKTLAAIIIKVMEYSIAPSHSQG